MEGSRRSLAIAVTLSLLILCSGCATQHGPGATIPPGPSVTNVSGTNTIPAGPGVTSIGTKHLARVP